MISRAIFFWHPIASSVTIHPANSNTRSNSGTYRTFLRLRNGIPSHDTFNRVFAAIDPKEFLECFLRWTQSVRQAVAQEVVALDGKALRRALNRNESPKY